MSHLLERAGLVLALCAPCVAVRAEPSTSPPLAPAGPAPVAVRPAAPMPASRPASEPLIGNDLDELRRFEQSAFPHPAPAEARPGNEAADAPLPRPRPSAESPPPGLHSDQHAASSSVTRSDAPEPWLSKLARPDLPVRWDPKLIRYLEFYRSNPRGRAIMATWLRRAGRYGKLISQALHRHQLPQSLLYVAMIESGFNPRTTSRVGAAGLWQFMQSPGVSYGLTRDHWVDERRNPEKSTEAALRYLKDLYRRFGTWELALAAYNAGHGGVVLAVRKYNTNDYWQLCRYEAGLPWDTTLYVPKILAAAVVGANRGAFGFDQLELDPELEAALVAVPTSITLAQAAAAAGVSREIIEQLNPELQRGRTPPGKSWLRVPRTAEPRFYAGLASMKGQLARYKPYLVRLGDSVTEVARAHGISPAALRSLNGFEQGAELRAGVTILVPARGGDRSSASGPAPPAADEVALVPLPSDKPSALPGRRRVFYRVVMGDSLDEIARVMGVRRQDLASWNALDPQARLVSGMVLQAFVAPGLDPSKVALLDPKRVKVMPSGSEEFYSSYEERRGRKRIVYQIRDGDTLGSVGRRYGLTVGDLMRINQLGRKAKLSAGQTLVLYVESQRLKASPARATVSADQADSSEAAVGDGEGDGASQDGPGAGENRAEPRDSEPAEAPAPDGQGAPPASTE